MQNCFSITWNFKVKKQTFTQLHDNVFKVDLFFYKLRSWIYQLGFLYFKTITLDNAGKGYFKGLNAALRVIWAWDPWPKENTFPK